MKVAVIITDMQNDFVSPKGSFAKMGFDISNNSKVINNIISLKKSLKKLKTPVIYTACTYDDHFLTDNIRERFNRNEMDHPFAISKTWGAEIVNELKPEEDDYIIYKHRYSAFWGTNLDTLLKGININTIIFAGIETYVCLGLTAIDAYMLGYKVIIAGDCSSSIDNEEHNIALDYCRRYYGVVMNKNRIICKS